jgi:hypothetical protein
MAERVVVLVPDGEADEEQRRAWRDEALEHCGRRGYAVVGFAAKWEDAAYLVLQGEADIIVAAREGHFPPDRLPRTETPLTAPTDADAPPRQRRPRLGRRYRAPE